jgi:hypothetical protein
MHEVPDMVTVDCPWCEAPLALEAALLRCEDCRVEVEVDPQPVVESVALAA